MSRVNRNSIAGDGKRKRDGRFLEKKKRRAGIFIFFTSSCNFYFYFFAINCIVTHCLFLCLEKGKADSLKFEWLLTPWSKCSQTCGGSGFQVRAVQCIVRHNNVTKSVEASLCEDAGLANPDTPDATRPSSLASSSNNNRQPATVQKCGLDTCPHWVAGSWTPCHQSRCFTWNTGIKIKIKSHLLGTLAGIAVVHHAISCIQPECLYISFHFISFHL